MRSELTDRLQTAKQDGDLDRGCRAVGGWMQAFSHDLASPLASFRLELESLKHMSTRLQEDLGTADAPGVSAYLAEVLDIVENLEGALETATALGRDARTLGAEVRRLAPDR